MERISDICSGPRRSDRVSILDLPLKVRSLLENHSVLRTSSNTCFFDLVRQIDINFELGK